MDRRKVLLGMTATAAASPGWSQIRSRPPIVGFVGFATEAVDSITILPFREALRGARICRRSDDHHPSAQFER